MTKYMLLCMSMLETCSVFEGGDNLMLWKEGQVCSAQSDKERPEIRKTLLKTALKQEK